MSKRKRESDPELREGDVVVLHLGLVTVDAHVVTINSQRNVDVLFKDASGKMAALSRVQLLLPGDIPGDGVPYCEHSSE